MVARGMLPPQPCSSKLRRFGVGPFRVHAGIKRWEKLGLGRRATKSTQVAGADIVMQSYTGPVLHISGKRVNRELVQHSQLLAE